jgi:D-beta-D-heptose 7-phosphate kinase/D-beta-D-heptose 1-phosphate adenosyltransferase
MNLAETFRSLKVLVIGDAILDVYHEGKSTRNCPDAPDAPVIEDHKETSLLGGAANVAANAAALGAKVTLISQNGTGQDGLLFNSLVSKAGFGTRLIHRDGGLAIKERIVADGKIVCRVDTPRPGWLSSTHATVLARWIGEEWKKAEVVIVADYDLGLMSTRVIDQIAWLMSSYPKTLVVDAKDLAKYQSCKPTLITPNFDEYEKMAESIFRQSGYGRKDRVKYLSGMVFERSGALNIAVTLDHQGVMLIDRFTGFSHHINANPIKGAQVCGAGDTFTAAIALGLASNLTKVRAAEIAQEAAEIVIKKPRTAVCSIDELTSIKPVVVEQVKPKKPTVVLATGCFDVLTAGHVHLLEEAKKLGDKLIVGINSDESIAAIKPGRPVNKVDDRIKMLKALRCVDEVRVFGNRTPARLVEIIQPDVFVKGSDYSTIDLPERKSVEACGGKVVIIPRVASNSTTKTLEMMNFSPIKDFSAHYFKFSDLNG